MNKWTEWGGTEEKRKRKEETEAERDKGDYGKQEESESIVLSKAMSI